MSQRGSCHQAVLVNSFIVLGLLNRPKPKTIPTDFPIVHKKQVFPNFHSPLSLLLNIEIQSCAIISMCCTLSSLRHFSISDVGIYLKSVINHFSLVHNFFLSCGAFITIGYADLYSFKFL
jgi:hypothetical protein